MEEETRTKSDSGVKEEIVAYAAKQNLILDAGALEILEKEADFLEIMDKAIDENVFMFKMQHK